MDIACTLTQDQMAGRVGEWKALAASAVSREAIDGGLRLEFGPVASAPVAELARLAAAEVGCCSFFSFALTLDGRGAGLEVTAPSEAAELVAGLFS